ncbi:unnamed protein product, partial [marine sediment metagenome]
KGPSHRQLSFTNINIPESESWEINLTNRPLEFGDVNMSGIVDVYDHSFVKTCRESDSKRGDEDYEQGCQWADGNFDSEVNSTDVDLLFNTLAGDTEDE